MKRQRRTPEFKVRALALYRLEGFTKEAAFEKACAEHGTTPSGCMRSPNCHSYMHDDIEGWIKSRLSDGDVHVRDLMMEAGFVIEED